MSKESIVRYALPDKEDPFPLFKLIRVPEGYVIANKHISLSMQQAIASASDIEIAPAIAAYLDSEDLHPEELDEARNIIIEQIFSLKERLYALDVPMRTLEGRFNYIKREISAERRRDRRINFAFRFGIKTTKQYLLGSSKRKPTEEEQSILNNCGYLSAWEALYEKKGSSIFRSKNPFEPVLGMLAYGIREFTFVRSHGKEKISTYLTPIHNREKPLRIAA